MTIVSTLLGLARAGASPSRRAAFAGMAQTKIEFFFPVPVEGKLAREMTRLVKVYNEQPEGRRGHRRLYRQLRRHQAQGAGRGQGRQAAGGRADERQLPTSTSSSRATSSARAHAQGRRDTTRRQVPGGFLAGAACQRHGRRRALRRAVPQFDAAALLQRRALQGGGPRSRTSRRAPGPSWSTPPRS